MTMTHYLDHNATSLLRASARAAMQAALDAGGNASSVHGAGRSARARVDDAREHVAAQAAPTSVISPAVRRIVWP
jgi:cysteine desulfurase